jgi:hypothetical protein
MVADSNREIRTRGRLGAFDRKPTGVSEVLTKGGELAGLSQHNQQFATCCSAGGQDQQRQDACATPFRVNA